MLALGATLGVLLLATLVFINLRRAKTLVIEDLTPNVLLTRYPLVFVTGHRSLFYFLGYWEQIPHLLASHGFEVFHLSLPWQSRKRRVKHLQGFLQKRSETAQKFHLFVDSSTKPELESLLRQKDYPCLASVTHMQNGKATDTTVNGLSALFRPIEEVNLPTFERRSWVWTLHRILHPQLWKLSPKNSGFKTSPELNDLVLKRSQFLAERDLLHSESSPSLKQ